MSESADGVNHIEMMIWRMSSSAMNFAHATWQSEKSAPRKKRQMPNDPSAQRRHWTASRKRKRAATERLVRGDSTTVVETQCKQHVPHVPTTTMLVRILATAHERIPTEDLGFSLGGHVFGIYSRSLRSAGIRSDSTNNANSRVPDGQHSPDSENCDTRRSKCV